MGDEHLLAALWRCSERFDPTSRPPRKLTADEAPESIAEVDASDLFDHVASQRYEWTQEYTTEGYVKLLRTFSNVLALEPRPQAGLLQYMAVIDGRQGGRIGECIVNHLLVARTSNRARGGASLTV